MATINGTNTANTLNGTTSADTINALGGNDTVNGRGGNDTITGGTGYDQVTGSAGADVFVFRLGDAISSEPHDAIMDFQVGVDRVQFASGGVIGFEDDPEGIWVNYGSSASSWFQLRGVQSITEAQLTGSGGGTSPPLRHHLRRAAVPRHHLRPHLRRAAAHRSRPASPRPTPRSSPAAGEAGRTVGSRKRGSSRPAAARS